MDLQVSILNFLEINFHLEIKQANRDPLCEEWPLWREKAPKAGLLHRDRLVLQV